MSDGVIKRAIFNLIGIIISVLPVTVATLSYFPIWREYGTGAVVSGFAALLLVVCASPIFRFIGARLSSPSAHTVWFILFIIFFILSKIAREMTVISLVGFISNLISVIFFKLGGRRNES